MIGQLFLCQSNLNSLLFCGVFSYLISYSSGLSVTESLTNCSLTQVGSGTEDQSLELGDSVVLNITCAGRLVKDVFFH